MSRKGLVEFRGGKQRRESTEVDDEARCDELGRMIDRGNYRAAPRTWANVRSSRKSRPLTRQIGILKGGGVSVSFCFISFVFNLGL
jgi:hypothetical protein